MKLETSCTGIFEIHVLKKHIDSDHRNITYSCDNCEYKATQKISLKIHIVAIHRNVNYFCNKCEYKTSWKSNLKKTY